MRLFRQAPRMLMRDAAADCPATSSSRLYYHQFELLHRGGGSSSSSSGGRDIRLADNSELIRLRTPPLDEHRNAHTR